MSDLFNAPARVWSVAGSLLQPIIDSSASKRSRCSNGAQRAGRAAYQQSVVDALRRCDDALIAHKRVAQAFEAQE